MCHGSNYSWGHTEEAENKKNGGHHFQYFAMTPEKWPAMKKS